MVGGEPFKNAHMAAQNECNGDLSPIEEIYLPVGGSDYLLFADDALKMCPASSHQFCESSRRIDPRSTFAPLIISCGRENSSGA
jgi:hypothetical protein